MATKNDCIMAAIRAGVPEEDARLLVDEIMGERDKMLASGQVDNINRNMAERFMQKAKAARIKAKTQRRMAAHNIVVHDAIQGFVAQVKLDGGDMVDAMEALLVGSSKTFSGSRTSASRLGSSLKALWGGSMANELERAGLSPLLKKDRAFSDDVMREMITPGGTGDNMARQAADIFSRFLENARLQLNDYGANIDSLNGYAPQSHDTIKMRKANEGEWTEFIADKLDWESTFRADQSWRDDRPACPW